VEWSFSTAHFNMAMLAVTAVAATVAKMQAELSRLNLKPKFIVCSIAANVCGFN
jgi:hypothetical protein